MVWTKTFGGRGTKKKNSISQQSVFIHVLFLFCFPSMFGLDHGPRAPVNLDREVTRGSEWTRGHALTLSRVRLSDPWTLARRLLCPRDFPGKNTGVGGCALLQGTFLTQGSNLHPLHRRPLSQQGSPVSGRPRGKTGRHQTRHRTKLTLSVKRGEKRPLAPGCAGGDGQGPGLWPLDVQVEMARAPGPTQAPTTGTLSVSVEMSGFE